jgi:hypothetical protein
MPKASRRSRPPRTGIPEQCRHCRKRVWWFSTQFGVGQRVMLDYEPVPDDDERARYWIDFDAAPPIAVSWAKQRYRPEAVGKPKYSSHGDTCQARVAEAVSS